MRQNSIFAILLRSPWWISMGVAAVIGVIGAMTFPAIYRPYAIFTGGPFLVIGCIAAWRQFGQLTPTAVKDILAQAGTMAWPEFSGKVEQAFVAGGYQVTRLNIVGADLEISKDGRSSLISGKRWKAAAVGIEPLKELQAAVLERGAQAGICLTAGEVSDNARRFALLNKIDLVHGARLAQMLSQGSKAERARAAAA